MTRRNVDDDQGYLSIYPGSAVMLILVIRKRTSLFFHSMTRTTVFPLPPTTRTPLDTFGNGLDAQQLLIFEKNSSNITIVIIELFDLVIIFMI